MVLIVTVVVLWLVGILFAWSLLAAAAVGEEEYMRGAPAGGGEVTGPADRRAA